MGKDIKPRMIPKMQNLLAKWSHNAQNTPRPPAGTLVLPNNAQMMRDFQWLAMSVEVVVAAEDKEEIYPGLNVTTATVKDKLNESIRY